MPNLETDYAGVREYIGARYVPVFADPVEWSDTRAYEPLTIVTYQGASYTSARYIPTGIPISDESYWVRTFDFDAQVEAYRTETRKVASDLANETQARISGDDGLSNRISAEATARQDADDALHSVIDKLEVAVPKVRFADANNADQPGIGFTFADGKKRLLYAGDDFVRLFDPVEKKQLWSIDAFYTTYDAKTDMRVNYRNNIAFVNLTGYVVNWPASPTREWFQLATPEELKLHFPVGGISHYYAVMNTDYESLTSSATCRLGSDGLFVRYSSPEQATFYLYGQLGVTATAYRTSAAAMSDDGEPREDWVIVVDDPTGYDPMGEL